MNLAIAIPFSKRPPKGYASVLRASFPGAQIIATQPADSTGVRGPDKLLYHLNVTSTNAVRIADYANGIFRPLILEAKNRAELVLHAHENVEIDPKQVAKMVSIMERIPSLRFISGAPRRWEGGTPEAPHVVVDNTDRLILFRSAGLDQLVEPFPVDPEGRTQIDQIMDRILEAGETEAAWKWMDDIIPVEH